jgi:hypothetical protein
MPTTEMNKNLMSKAWRDAHMKPSEDNNPDWIESEEVREEGT